MSAMITTNTSCTPTGDEESCGFSNLIKDVYDRYMDTDRLTSKELRDLKEEYPTEQDHAVLQAFHTSLEADDYLSPEENQKLENFGVCASDLKKYDLNYGWVKKMLPLFDNYYTLGGLWSGFGLRAEDKVKLRERMAALDFSHADPALLTALRNEPAFENICETQRNTCHELCYEPEDECFETSEEEVCERSEDLLEGLRGKVPDALLDQLVLIPAGTFMMGRPDDKNNYNERSQHEVTITHDFYASKFEVTNAIWREVMGTDPSEEYGPDFTADNQPVVSVSWHDTQEFFKKLNAKLGPNAKLEFRLPTEAEWEYMAKGPGGSFEYPTQDGQAPNATNANWNGDTVNTTCTSDVGTYPAGPFGMSDMAGNVYEWTSDWYADSYDTKKTKNPTGPENGTIKVLRGGSWSVSAEYARSAFRDGNDPGRRSDYGGFRLAASFQD